ncbi:hypothetical protein JDS75_24795 [Bacillus cereus]|uniref:hypothetical protein n=1 Tax=Bacillus mycoides TaxID=1405 RepID=UPI001A29A511|nr:hypothetical protein [Bacillus mycoides]MBJ7997680.1 hypothetical protein [Bacillus cereus]
MKKRTENIERITMFIGLAIIYLGIIYIFNLSTIPSALVTGISISGFCITLSDFFNKLNEDKYNKFMSQVSEFLYFLAAISIITFPYMTVVISLPKDTLDKMSTITSVIALGLVFVSIGFNNKREVLKDAKERDTRYENLLTNFENATFTTRTQVKQMSEQTKQIAEQTEGLSEQTEGLITLIEKKDERIKELEKKLHDLETKNSTPSV